VQPVWEVEFNVSDTLIVQLPDGLGPYEISPASVAVTGNCTSLPVKLISVATVTFGSPLIVRFETEQLVGVIVSVVLSDPSPELFRVKSKAPETPIVPPPGHAPL
jgi:hypothetical protein